MPGGMAIVQQSSQAWATAGSQAESALNSGWILDQQFGATGNLISNVSPTSVAGVFQSTGNGTAFYSIGRGLQIVQGAATVISTVGQTSFALGVTSVFLNQFSTAPGLSTTLSSGVITSVAASPVTVGSTIGNVFSGGLTVVPTTGAGATWTLISGLTANGGITAGSTGSAVVAHFTGITLGGVVDWKASAVGTHRWVDAAYANINMSLSDLGNMAVRGTLQISGANMAVGVGPAGSGVLRLPYSTGLTIVQRNAGGTADEVVWPIQYATTSLAADVAISTAAGVYTDGPALNLGAGTWFVQGSVEVLRNQIGYLTAKLWDGVTLLAAAEAYELVAFNTYHSMYLCGIASSSSQWKISVATTGGSTDVLKASGGFNGNPGQVSYLRAFKIS